MTISEQARDVKKEADAFCEMIRIFERDGEFTISADVAGFGRITLAVGPNAALNEREQPCRPSHAVSLLVDEARPTPSSTDSPVVSEREQRLVEALRLIKVAVLGTDWDAKRVLSRIIRLCIDAGVKESYRELGTPARYAALDMDARAGNLISAALNERESKS